MESQVEVILSNIIKWFYSASCVVHIIVRLVGGNSYDEGRVEVYYNGEWGTVCNDGWDDIDASVVCKQLGFGSSGTAILDAQIYGPGTGRVLLSNVLCSSNDTTLSSCAHRGVGITACECDHYKDAGVTCNSMFSINWWFNSILSYLHYI